jgi:hypothetical protein
LQHANGHSSVCLDLLPSSAWYFTALEASHRI